MPRSRIEHRRRVLLLSSANRPTPLETADRRCVQTAGSSVFETRPQRVLQNVHKAWPFYECKDSGLNIAGGYYDCALLVDVNHASQSCIGAYGSRQKLCNLANQSGCCRTCTMHGLYAPKPKPTKSHLHGNKETHKKEETTPSFCRDTGLRIADGSYDCAMLIDKEYRNQAMIGAYSARHKLCSRRMFSGCCDTCQRHVIGRTRRHCKDEYVVVLKNKSTYTCRELLQRKSDIYSDRFELCADTVNTKCCKACKKVLKTKDNEGLTHYTNLVNKPTGLDSSTKDGSQNTSNIDTKEVGSTLKPYVNGNANEAGSTLPLNANVDTKVGSTLKPTVNSDAKEAGSKLPLNANIVTEEAGSTRPPNAEVEVSDGHKVFQLMMELIKRFNKFKAFTKKDLKALTHALESIRNGQS